ncbi:MAG: phosphodiesterase [Rhodobacteraceae bacterium]|nr:phosphodiesterase [Paracoccaceae bacterium]
MRPTLDPRFLGPPIAHRAFHDRAAGRPENSLAAIAAAVAAGYGIEIDVQLSADGQAMVFHDATLDRMTAARGPVALRRAAELGAIRLRDGAEGIPTLPEVLAAVAGRSALLVEVKDQDGAMGPAVGELEARVAADLAGYGGPVAVMSFNPHSVAALARLLPGVARGLTTAGYEAADWGRLAEPLRRRLRAIEDYDAVGASFISHEARDLGRDPVGALRARGAAILCWTIRSPAAEAEARRIADNVTFEGYAAAIPGG